MPTLHAFDTLIAPLDWQQQSFLVLFGDDSFLKQRVLHLLTEDYENVTGFPATVFDGTQAQWRDVADEVATISLFSASTRRVAIVDDADPFISNHRDRLEDLLDQAPEHGCLVLMAHKWLPNTRLYKAVDRVGLQVECRAPLEQRRGSKAIDEPRIIRWLIDWADRQHQCRLSEDAAKEMLGLVGPMLGVLDQDLAKLALYVRPDEKIDVQKIRTIVGGWRQQTVWEILDAGLDGQVAEAIAQLDHLLQAGEAVPAVFAQISWALRRFAQATDLYLRQQRNRERGPLVEILKQAGFRDWPAGSLKANETRLVRLGRERAAQLHRWLLETDLALKGSHSSPGRARFALEYLFMRMSRHLRADKIPG